MKKLYRMKAAWYMLVFYVLALCPKAVFTQDRSGSGLKLSHA